MGRIHFKAILSEIQVVDIVAADPVEYLTRSALALSDIERPSLLILEFVEGLSLAQPNFPAQFRIEMQWRSRWD